jgi:ribonuclease D
LRKEVTKYLKNIFENPAVLKIFHGCDNDLAWLISNFELYTRNIFDTARAFLSFQKVIVNCKTYKAVHLPSLGYLSKFFLHTELDKSYQRSDWRIRPLTDNMLQYALNDAKTVIYIFHLYIGLLANLEQKEELSDYYEKLCLKFTEYNQKSSGIDKEQIYYILYETSLTTYELMRVKLKDKYIKLLIENIN